MIQSSNLRPHVLKPVAALVLFLGVGIGAHDGSPSPVPEQDSPSVRWSRAIPFGSSDPCLDSASVESRGVAIGPDQDVIAVGRIAGEPTRVVVVKYDGNNGQRVWCHSFALTTITPGGTALLAPAAEVGGIAIDGSGTIFIGGDGTPAASSTPSSKKPGPVPVMARRYFAMRCSAAGACASAVTFIDPLITGVHHDTMGGMAIGPDGNLVLTGLAEYPATNSNRSTFTLLTVKVSGSTFALLGTAQASSKAPNAASAQGVAVDASNSIFVTGTEASTLNYDPILSSRPVWTRPLAGARIAAGHRDGDPADVVQVAVLRMAPNAALHTQDIAVTMLLGDTGVTRWTKTYGSGLNDSLGDVALDHRGNILVAGDRDDGDRDAHSPLPQGQLVSLTPAGDVSWAALFPASPARTASSFAAVAVDVEGDPVVSGDSQLRSNAPVVMNVLKYDLMTLPHPADGSDNDSDHNPNWPHDARLAWDQAISDTVADFRVCIDDQTGMACQDVGRPEDLNPRIIPSTTPRSRTYDIALSRLTSFKPGKHRISVVAYNAVGSAESKALTVMGHGQHTEFESEKH